MRLIVTAITILLMGGTGIWQFSPISLAAVWEQVGSLKPAAVLEHVQTLKAKASDLLATREVVQPPRAQEQAGQAGGGQPDQSGCSAVGLYAGYQGPLAVSVTRVIDGDTVEVATGGREIKVRLWGIDAPEMGQPYGPASREALEDMVSGANHRVTLHPVVEDVYGRTVAVLQGMDAGEQAINVGLVADGHAYHVDAFESQGNECLRGSEETAKASGVGLWRGGGEGRTPPWEYRRQQRER